MILLGASVEDRVLGKDNTGVGQALITALADFIIPLIQGDTTAPDPSRAVAEDPHRSVYGAVHPGSGLTIEGQELLVALKRFAVSLVHTPEGQQKEQNSSEISDKLQEVSSGFGHPATVDVAKWVEPDTSTDIQLLGGWDGNMWEASGLGLISSETVNSRYHRLIKVIMDDARDMVFNTMPIRLLMFDEEGNGIKLVEKSEVLKHISLDLATFDFREATSSFIQDNGEFRPLACRRFLSRHKFGQYAILSHTWLPTGEVTYSDWLSRSFDTTSPGYVKLANFCKVAAVHYGLRLAWMDTVCINKESSAELDESIRSMFKWYKGTRVCITYLAETASLDVMGKDRWFTRGWTLQELLAPSCIKFYTVNWTAISDIPAYHCDKSKLSPLVSKICGATSLSKEELFHSPYLDHIPIWRKMQWASSREVTREEDAVYSLMGIFNVSMPTGYGEGSEHAFLRLVREILNSKLTSVSKLEIANWKTSSKFLSDAASPSALIPRDPRSYVRLSANRRVHFYPPSSPITLSHLGLSVPVLLMPSIQFAGTYRVPSSLKGDYSATARLAGYTYKILDGTLFSDESPRDICIFAVLNIADKSTEVLLPENGTCLAIQLLPQHPVDGWTIPEGLEFKRKYDMHPVTFDIVCHNGSSVRIPKDELDRHGITLRTMYL
ncbi:hypothetical protein HYPSUDRAFT_219643 [Hypholoma sublateritium FD-334 SS-4]|uniref:Heterokaryon incompatibility domain-containing protein n=1 Tax=Hypholoma sublateritium (strain FD-334 SS-4) TaxID=945553 RepID=A0A0D2P6Y8_HYPSF|nr:hypothetical protein HYPSUDRAFT_219643 [Hypholoma sublateritium FD-334 SS-4]